jgi:hypothetical protein
MIIIPAQLESIASRKDKTIKLVFGANELTPNTSGQLFNMANAFGFLSFKEEEFRKEELDIVESLKADIELTGKTPAQRLRGVMYKLYQQNDGGFSSFAKYYEHQMEIVISHFKTKID